ncbi:MAG: acyl-CoA dehydrogenase family protein [Polyangiaceae bacterium]|nr:acyl-CoA dehydrogenase family protein [Polyangiaceae bacterium]
MDFSFDESATELRARAVAFAREHLTQDVTSRDENQSFSRALWTSCADFGLLGLPFPTEYGGSGADILSTMLVMEGLGYGGRDNGLLFAVNAQMWAVQHPIATFGTTAQKERWLGRLIQGEIIGAHGMTEADSGSDAFRMRTRATRQDNGYVLDGVKTFVTNAPVADLAVVFAVTDPARGSFGISAFVVEKGMPGFSTGKSISKMGLRTSPMGELALENCFVPEENRLGREGQGSIMFSSSMEWERACILGIAVGAMERQLETCVEYARTRHQFDKPIGQFQAVSHRLADMKVRLETARLLLYKVAWLKKMGKPAHLEAAMAKLHLSEVFVQSSLDAIRIHGGYGYATEFEVERDLRDAVGGTIYSGTSDMQRNIIARFLGVGT